MEKARGLLLEGLVIVISILAAFALDRWWDARMAAEEEQQVLDGLQSEFQDARTELVYYRSLQVRIRGAVERALVAFGQAGAGSTVAVADTTLGLVYIPPTVKPSLGTLDGLLAGARLGIVSDPDLRNALVSWGGVFDELSEEEEASRDYVMNHVDPALRSRVDVTVIRSITIRDMGEGLTEREQRGITTLPVDNELIGVFAGRLMYLDHGIDEYEPVLEHVDRILELIETSSDAR
jgi:hypothetical protein